MSTTTGAAADRRLKPARILGASAAVALVALSVIAGAALSRAHERDIAVDVTAAGAEVEHAFEGATAALLDRSGPSALGSTSRGPIQTPPGFLGSAVVSAPAASRISAGDLGPVADPLEVPEIRAALDVARDSADVVVSAPVETARGSLPVVVVPIYRGAAGPTLQAGPTVPARRQAISSWWLGSVDVEALTAAALAATDRNDLGLTLTDGATVLASAGDPSFASRDADLEVPPRSWTLSVGAVSGPAPPATAVTVVGVGLVLAVGVVALSWWSDRRRQQLHRAHREIEAQLRLVTEIGPVVQQSLELADVLPTVALRLMDDLGLAGVACALVGDHGRPVDLFAVGAPVDSDTPVRLSVPERVEEGQTLALSLQRGGRSVGVLRVIADRSLGGAPLRSLSAVADLATAAIINARLFEQQQEAVGRLQQVDELKTVFLGTASHELRTPVTAIVGFARLLTEGWDGFTDDERRQYTERISRNAHALDRLVQDLLDFARLERGGLRTGSEPVDLARVIPQAVRGIEPAHPEHRLEVSVDGSAVILGDRSGVERILNNLVSNATKYSPSGSTVAVAVRGTSDQVELTVDDQGPGVAPADRERIFSRFFRGAGEEVVRTRGAGIGLSVVQEFVEQMDGEIRVVDSPSGGARFVVRFPALEGTAPIGRDAVPEGSVEEGTAHVPRA